MKYILIFHFIVHLFAQPEDHNEMINLTDENFNKTLNELDGVLVLFLGNECEFCRIAEKALADASLILSTLYGINNVTAKMHLTDQSNARQESEQQELPRLHFFQKIVGEAIALNSGITKEEIVSFIIRKRNVSMVQINSTRQFDLFTSLNTDVAIYFSLSAVSDAWVNLGASYESALIGYVLNEEIIRNQNFNLEDFHVRLYNNDSGRILDYKGHDSIKDYCSFLDAQLVKIIYEFNTVAVDVIFHRAQNAVFLILDQEAEELEKVFHNLAKKNKKNPLAFSFSRSQAHPHLHKKLVDYLGANFVQTPAIFVNEPITHHSFFFEGRYNENEIQQFIDQYLEKKLSIFVKSEPIPQNQTREYLKVVGFTYNEIVLSNDKDVFVSFCRYGDDTQCEEFLAIFEDVARKVKHLPELQLATYDVRLNWVSKQNYKTSCQKYKFQDTQL